MRNFERVCKIYVPLTDNREYFECKSCLFPPNKLVIFAVFSFCEYESILNGSMATEIILIMLLGRDDVRNVRTISPFSHAQQCLAVKFIIYGP